jgi:hypothetical protein
METMRCRRLPQQGLSLTARAGGGAALGTWRLGLPCVALGVTRGLGFAVTMSVSSYHVSCTWLYSHAYWNMFGNKSTHAYITMTVMLHVSFYSYMACVTNLQLWYVQFQVCTCILWEPNSPAACSPCCTSKMCSPCLCLSCKDC